MAFVKLDTGILNSTLWVERECRELFITALLMAVPFEVETPMEQFEVHSLNHTGFVVPVGWYGLVRAAGVGICRMAMVEAKVGLIALERLGSPDPESRSKDFDGRRLVRVDGGFIVLNYMKYRERDDTAAERSRRYRERVASRRSATPSHRDITQGEGDVEVEVEDSKEKEDLAAQGGASPPASTHACPHVEIVTAYHRHLPMGRQVNLKVWNGTRKKHLQARWREDKERQSVDWWENFFTYCAKSAFLTGKVLPRQGRDPFQVSLDWIVNPSNFAKIIEGAYER